uniref:non-specific serine/threonine protein kinase n=1 Tax=Peronospora matthiolae TaxID=2874970 RepID=A0AAV1U5K1_9STRA
MTERSQPLALVRVTELEVPFDRSSTQSTNCNRRTCREMERLQAELGLEIQPQRLHRQYTLNVLPVSAASRSSASQSGVLDAIAPRCVGGRTPKQEFGRDSDGDETVPMLEDGGHFFENVRRPETFDVTFGAGDLGLEVGIDAVKNKVVVKSVQMETWIQAAVAPRAPGTRVRKGLTVEAVNGQTEVSVADVLDELQFSKRPMTVTFRRATMVVCKLCETKVDANSLDEHINYCVLSKRVELEADVINDSLVQLTASLDASLVEVDAVGKLDELHAYHALRMAAVQTSSCDVTSVDAFALCAQLVKVIDRIRQQEETLKLDVRGVAYCVKLRNLIHAKMSKMRASHKVMFQQAPIEIMRSPLKRTKSLESIKNRRWLRSRRRSSLRPTSYRVSIRDFQIVKPISKGAFGKVYLARKKTTGDQYAIKVLAKEHLLRKNQIQQIETERNILASVVSPFVVKLFWTFQTKRNLFLVMEYLPGGDFMSLLECIVQLEEQVACVYIAEIAIALNLLHTKGCVHRDMKPDNILLSSTGHIKLTDFGLSEEAVALSDIDLDPDDECVAEGSEVRDSSASEVSPFTPEDGRPRCISMSKRNLKKQSAYHTYGRCGTPDYLAPEIILGVPHGPPVDYWALGIILYEMMVGFPPFNDDTVDAIFENILERQILWPDGEKCLSPEAVDLIDKLLDPNPETRMNWEGIKQHKFFDGINWDTILESVPPFVPTLEGPTDTSYFNNRNLTDVFIDDDEFDISSRSACSSQNNVDFGPECDDPSLGVPDSKAHKDFIRNNNASNVSAATADVDTSWGTTGTLGALDSLGATNKEHIGRVLQTEDSNNHCRFPSGMYDSTDDSKLCDAFRSFSFTNMNALAAASQAEAEMITDTTQPNEGVEFGPSIFI